MTTAVCERCHRDFEPEHPAQTVCRVCVSTRCAICRVYIDDGFVYCGPTCRQRARAGARYVILNRDDYTCRACGMRADEDNPQFLKLMRVESWSYAPTAANTVTLCDKCAMPVERDIPPDWGDYLAKRNRFFGIVPTEPLRVLSRGEKRRRSRK